MYEYRCKVTRVIDGDTLALAVDLGCDITVNMTVRLYGVNCPEMHGETRDAGLMARLFTMEWLNTNDPDTDGSGVRSGWFTLETVKDKREKYGRYLGTIRPWVGLPGTGRQSLNSALLTNDHAKVYLS